MTRVGWQRHSKKDTKIQRKKGRGQRKIKGNIRYEKEENGPPDKV
jgi:hypothetical protein